MGIMTAPWDPADAAGRLAGEAQVPVAVRRVAEFLHRRGVWFSLSRNREARSCRDAAHKRWRLGHQGIPLWDELKSYFGHLVDKDGHQQYVVVHCRGDRLLAMDRLAKTLGCADPPERLAEAELETLGMAYGLVHPFIPWSLDGQLITSPILQVFDEDVLRPVGIPGTVMTNAGDITWAVEFYAQPLVSALDNVVVADISDPDPEEPVRPASIQPTLGIITGNAPESGILLWDRINAGVRELMGDDNLGDVSMPRLFVHSVPELGLSMELATRHEPVWAALQRAAEDMCAEGVQILSLACNTTHYFASGLSAICAERGAEFLSMPAAVAEWLRHRGVRKVALVGIRYVSDLGPWSAYREPFADFEVERPSPRAMQRLDELAYQVKKEGPNESGLTRLRDILRQEVESDHVVVALTELSLLLDRQRRPGRSGKTLIDPLSVYADALVARYLGSRFPPPDGIGESRQTSAERVSSAR